MTGWGLWTLLLFFVSTTRTFNVYVLLDKKPILHKEEREFLWRIQAPAGIMVRDREHPDDQHFLHGTAWRVRYDKEGLSLNGKPIEPASIIMEPAHGYLKVNGKEYAGSLAVVAADGFWHLINKVDLEDYVYSVLRYESYHSWPLEVNKAFAIMLRSYVTAKITKVRNKSKKGKAFLYDIGCTNADQTYGGVHPYTNLRTAVDETKSIILTYDKKPIEAMYDVCCGGFVPERIKGLNAQHTPYLARNYACTYCTDCKVYGWQARYTLSECTKLFTAAGITSRSVKGLTVTELDDAGLVDKLVLEAGKRSIPLSRKTVYGLFKDIKSYSFTVTKEGDDLVFHGRGYGHHLGLCQWGARQMIDRGFSCVEVLEFYYPGTIFMKLV